jgi:peptidoglycan/xylan/chitin deacetylase (PgdA/CDA1 family)
MTRFRHSFLLEVTILITAALGLASCSGSPATKPPSGAKAAQEPARPESSSPPPESAPATLAPIEKSLVSGLPYPSAASLPRPTAEPGGVAVLDWAGFKSALTYSFDDGQPSQIEHYRELEAAGVPLTFYISEGWSGSSPDFVATWSQAAKEGHELGNHTVHHSHSGLEDSGTGGTPLADQELEIAQNAKYLSAVLGQKEVWSMASPYGDMGWSRYARAFYLFNRGVGLGKIAPRDRSDPLNLPVYMAKGGEREQDLDRRIDAARAEGKWLVFLFHSLLPTSQAWYAPVEIGSVTGSIRHARASGEVWIDALYKIAAYWLGQKIFEENEALASGKDLVWTWKLPEHFPSGSYLRVVAGGGTLSQGGKTLAPDPRGFYELSLDSGSLTLSP